jgi:tRNA_anti-like
MDLANNKYGTTNWLHLVFGAALAVTFFLPLLSWEGNLVSGSAMASGNFFKISVAVSGPDNPFPKLSFAFYLFWLIPALAVLSILLVLLRKSGVLFSFFAGALSLALLTVYFLFSKTLALDFGVGKNVSGMLKPAAYIHVLSAVGLIATAFPVKNIFSKIIWLLIGPVIAYGSYKIGEKYITGETHTATESVKTDYTINAADLLKEFSSSDTAANNKYKEKVIVLNGKTSAVEILPDSTSTIKFADSTGSYAIFSFEKSEFDKIKTINQDDAVSLKAICSGGIFSEILGTTVITFKRATFNSNQ